MVVPNHKVNMSWEPHFCVSILKNRLHCLQVSLFSKKLHILINSIALFIYFFPAAIYEHVGVLEYEP